MKFVKLTAVAATLAALSGCATAPMQHDIEKTHAFAEPKDVIWERAVNFFAERNLSIKTIEKASGIIAADRTITAPTTGIEGFADCGKAPLMIPTSQTIDLNLFVRTLPNGNTTVTVNAQFTETRRFGQYPPVTVSCTSTGKIEQAILGSLGHEI